MAQHVESKVDDRDLRQLFWRSFLLQSAFNYERMQSLGFTWSLMPLIKKLYKTKEDQAAALKRHLTFFNTHPWNVGAILGMVASLEERKSKEPEAVDEEGIQAIKGGLMGPLAGIGDSLFFGALRPVVAGLAVTLALTGNGLAPLIFLVIVNIVHFWIRWEGVKQGYRLGDQFLQKLESYQVHRWMEAATMLGLMVVGALVATWLNVTTPLTYTMQDASVSIQEMLDGILPKALPLLATWLVFKYIRKGVSATTVMLAMVAVGLVGGYFGILK